MLDLRHILRRGLVGVWVRADGQQRADGLQVADNVAGNICQKGG